ARVTLTKVIELHDGRLLVRGPRPRRRAAVHKAARAILAGLAGAVAAHDRGRPTIAADAAGLAGSADPVAASRQVRRVRCRATPGAARVVARGGARVEVNSTAPHEERHGPGNSHSLL